MCEQGWLRFSYCAQLECPLKIIPFEQCSNEKVQTFEHLWNIRFVEECVQNILQEQIPGFMDLSSILDAALCL